MFSPFCFLFLFLFLFFFLKFLFVSYLRKFFLLWGHKCIFSIILPAFISCPFLISSIIILGYILYMVWSRSQASFFMHGNLTPHHYLLKSPSPLLLCCSFLLNLKFIYVWVIFWVLILYCHLSVFVKTLHFVTCYKFKMNLGILQSKSPNLSELL